MTHHRHVMQPVNTLHFDTYRQNTPHFGTYRQKTPRVGTYRQTRHKLALTKPERHQYLQNVGLSSVVDAADFEDHSVADLNGLWQRLSSRWEHQSVTL